MAYSPNNNKDELVSKTLNGVGESISIAVAGQSSWTVQAVGTFVAVFRTEVSLNGTDWVPANTRQTGAAPTRPTFSMPGIYRGNCGGLAYVRVVCISHTSGSAKIIIKTGGVGAIFTNATTVTQDQFQYFASSSGGNTAFNASTGPVTIPPTGGNVCLFMNPANSKMDAYIKAISVGSNTAGRIERFRGPTVTSTANPMPAINRGGSENQASCFFYGPANHVTSNNGVTTRVTFLGANESERVEESGSIIIRPNQNYLFRFDPGTVGGNNNQAAIVSVEIVWWESGQLT